MLQKYLHLILFYKITIMTMAVEVRMTLFATLCVYYLTMPTKV